MNTPDRADYEHLLRHAQNLFPNASIEVIHTEDEAIHIDVDCCRFTFEIGSDDDAYVFGGPHSTFTIPLMENPDAL